MDQDGSSLLNLIIRNIEKKREIEDLKAREVTEGDLAIICSTKWQHVDKWKQFPAIGEVLGDKEISSDNESLSSVLEIIIKSALIVIQNKNAIIENIQHTGSKLEIYQDLNNLVSKLEEASAFLTNRAEYIRKFMKEIENTPAKKQT